MLIPVFENTISARNYIQNSVELYSAGLQCYSNEIKQGRNFSA